MSFIIYPSEPQQIGETIQLSIEYLRDRYGNSDFYTWQENDIPGRFIITPVLSSIEESRYIVADITRLNFNVTYEIGYAIGMGRRVVLIRNRAIATDDASVRYIGIYDTLGYKEYQNSDELCEYINTIEELSPLPIDYSPDLAPVFILETPTKSNEIRRIITGVKNARLRFRNFDPSEELRLSAPWAIRNVASSHGVIVPLLPSTFAQFSTHNMRAAFVMGIAHGLGKPLLALQPQTDDPIPLDYRDLVSTYRRLPEIDSHIADFIPYVVEQIQAHDTTVPKKKGLLASLDLGSPTAENEMQSLSEYFVQTDAFLRTGRGEGHLVVGRKGAGKTAIFTQVRDEVRSDKRNIVLDLKPEGYQLRKFKDIVLVYLAAGSKEHVIVAFWEYLLLLETCYKLLEKDQEVHKRDHRLYEPYQRLKAGYEAEVYVTEGDFSERMWRLIDRISESYRIRFGETSDIHIQDKNLTEILYMHDLARLKSNLAEYMKYKQSLWILFDNLDKAWATRGLDREDVVIFRGLLDASRKLERFVRRNGQSCHAMIFIREDVYRILIEETPDRGKDPMIGLDWTEPDMLREVVRRRLVFNGLPEHASFEQLWRQVCVSHIHGVESSEYLIDRSLMRPRYFLRLIEDAKGFAINLSHEKIEVEDIESGIKSYSTGCILEVGLELRDVLPESEDVLYSFLGEEFVMSQEKIFTLFESGGYRRDIWDELFDLLLWHGVLGIVRENGEFAFIYDVNYDMKRLNTIVLKRGVSNVNFVINPALWEGLEVVTGRVGD